MTFLAGDSPNVIEIFDSDDEDNAVWTEPREYDGLPGTTTSAHSRVTLHLVIHPAKVGCSQVRQSRP